MLVQSGDGVKVSPRVQWKVHWRRSTQGRGVASRACVVERRTRFVGEGDACDGPRVAVSREALLSLW